MTGRQLIRAPNVANERRLALVRFRGRPWSISSVSDDRETRHVTIPPQLHLMRLRFSLQATSHASLPPHKSRLFYHALRRHLGTIWCRQTNRCGDGCQSPIACLFGRLMEPHVDVNWSPPMRRWIGSTPPPACVVWDEQDRRIQIAAGDLLHFELTLIGELAIRQFTAFIAAVMVASEQGIGRERLKARLVQVDVLTGPSGQATPMLIDSIWQGDPNEGMTLGYADGLTWADQVASPDARPLTQLGLRFLSPTRLEAQGTVMHEPHFQLLVRAIVRRLRILGQVHGEGDWLPSAYKPLVELADTVQLERHETMWISTIQQTQNGEERLEGFVGQAWYTSPTDLRPLLPMLWLGQWAHVGKATVWGNGRYAMQMHQQGGAANDQ